MSDIDAYIHNLRQAYIAAEQDFYSAREALAADASAENRQRFAETLNELERIKQDLIDAVTDRAMGVR